MAKCCIEASKMSQPMIYKENKNKQTKSNQPTKKKQTKKQKNKKTHTTQETNQT